jgi:hypothetical protein
MLLHGLSEEGTGLDVTLGTCGKDDYSHRLISPEDVSAPNGFELSGPAKSPSSEIAELAGSAPASG